MAQAEFSHVAILADLQLRNFRCFEGLALQFESGFNFFVGPNGEGKNFASGRRARPVESIAIELAKCIQLLGHAAGASQKFVRRLLSMV